MNNFEDFKYVKGFGGKGSSTQQAAQPTAAYEDPEGFIYAKNSVGGVNYNVYQFAKVKDLLSEGPIDGLVDGQYVYNGSVGNLGYTSVIYNQYPIVLGEDSKSVYLRSIYWNQTPLLDSQNKYNFQQINVNATNGTPIGTALGEEFENVSYIRSIGERLRGPNFLSTTADEIADYQRSYRILNKECKKLFLNFTISSLYTTLKYQDLAAVNGGKTTIDGVTKAFPEEGYFILSPAGRELSLANQTDASAKAGVGSVLYHSFKVRIKINSVYKEGYNSGTSTIDMVTGVPKVITDGQDLSISVDNIPNLIEITFKGKVTQGYSKQIMLDMSTVFQGLNTNENWLGWEILVLKMTPEDTFSSRASFVSIESITEIYSSSFRYTNSATITSRFNAAYFSKIPERSYDVKLLKVKVPANYDPLTKTYGETTTRTISVNDSYIKTDKTPAVDYFIGENETYANANNLNPPIILGLIGQFGADNTTNGGATTPVTAWANRVVGGSLVCTLSASQPTYGKAGETSPNGSYGVSFTSAQTATFLDGVKFFADANGNCTIFVVSKWDASATPDKRKRILQGNTNTNWTLGNWSNYNKAFLFGSWVYGPMGADNGNFNLSNYWNTSNDSNTYIAGAVIRNDKNVNIFWQNSIYSVQTLEVPTAPQGLAINVREPSDCTVFEILIYNRALAKEEAIKVRNWLNNKWNVAITNPTFVNSTDGYNSKALRVLNTVSLTIPLKTICALGQEMKPYNLPVYGTDPKNRPYKYDLIPERFWKNTATIQPFNLQKQGFCSFYCDFYLKLDQSLADGNYSLIHRDGQFNLSITIGDNNTNLILTILTPNVTQNEQKKYTINKTLDQLKYSKAILKNKYTRFSLYILPKIVKPTLSYANNASEVVLSTAVKERWLNPGGNGRDFLTTDVLNVKENQYTKTLAASLGVTPSPDMAMQLLVNGVTFREDTTYQGDISNLAPLCTKYFAYTIGAFSTDKPIEILGVDYYPDILNAEIDILLDLEKEIQCNINVGDYGTYKAICVGIEHYLATDYTDWSVVTYSTYFSEIKGLRENVLLTRTNQALKDYNETDINGILTFETPNVVLSSNQTNVLFSLGPRTQEMGIISALLPIKASFVNNEPASPAMPSNISSGPFNPASFINNNSAIEIFTNKTAAGFGGKILGLADSIRVNQIEFDRAILAKAYSRTLFSESLPRKISTYTPSAVPTYASSNDYWDGNFKQNKEWTDNPAWCFYDLLTNKRYGAGNQISETDVDKWSLYQIGKYCDELVSDGFGGVEPRFSCNLYLQTQEDALKVLADMASIFRGMFYYANGFIFSINDMPEETPVYSFTNSNVINGNFNYESTSLKDRNSAVYVRYVDKNNFYKPAVEYVENIEAIRKFGFKETELTAFGCTSRGQAQRLGRWLLASEYNETETASFEAGPECIYLKPGDVIKIYDYNKKHKTVGGRLNYIDISGDVIATTGTLTLDRKLDFNFSGSQNYKLTILSPKYNIDPSFKDAQGNSRVTSSIDYNEYRKPLVNSFMINSGNLITGQYYDSIRITGLSPVMASELNVTGLAYFTGASGMSPKSITWALENSGNLDGSTDSDYDFYRIFRIQESTEGANYTILGSQVYNLKYTQIESGLNITPPKAPASPASPPSIVTFIKGNKSLTLGIYYESSIKASTIGFKIFTKSVYGTDFNPNTDTSSRFAAININESYINTTFSVDGNIDKIRVYGVNINNESSSSYVEAVPIGSNDSTNSTIIGLDAITTNAVVDGGAPLIFKTRGDFFPLVPLLDKDKAINSLSVNINLNFITDPLQFNDDSYPYRSRTIPEKVDSKEQFINILAKYQNSTPLNEYIFANDLLKTPEKQYVYSSNLNAAKYRNFSIAIDKANTSLVDGITYSTSKNFTNEKGFLLLTYDNQDSTIKTSLDNILNNENNLFSILSQETANFLSIRIHQDFADTFVSTFYLLLVPSNTEFKFGSNGIIYDEETGSPIGVKNSSNEEINNCHFIQVTNTSSDFESRKNVDDSGRPFSLTTYNIYLIAVDVLMSEWVKLGTDTEPRRILDYTSKFADAGNNVSTIYPQISDRKTIQLYVDPNLDTSIEEVLKNAGDKYLHFTFNQTIMIESLFNQVGYIAETTFPNLTLSRNSIIYKPTIDSNLGVSQKDSNVLSTNPNGNSAYYLLSLQNRPNITDLSFPPTIPSNKRAYVLNGNKLFTRALVSDEQTTSTPKLLQGIYGENANNRFQVSKGVSSASIYGEEFFDISIARLLNMPEGTTGFVKKVNESTSKNLSLVQLPYRLTNTTYLGITKETFQDSVKYDIDFYNSPFNAINVTPQGNLDGIGVSAQDVSFSLNYRSKETVVNFLDANVVKGFAPSVSTQGASQGYIAGIPLLDKIDNLQITIQIPYPSTDKKINVFCYNGEDYISSEISSNKITKDKENSVTITLYNLSHKNYYTYAAQYRDSALGGPDVLNNNPFWSFSDPKNLAFAHVSAAKALGKIPNHNFHIQALELSIIITYS